MKKGIPDRWFYFLIIFLGLNLLVRLIDQAKMMWIFPLDFTNDWSSFLAQLFFLGKCGFHATCNYWYNGFETFVITSPGWYFFAFPFYWVTGSVQVGAYLSVLAMFLVALVFSLLLGKHQGWSKVKGVAFFLLFFANAIAVGDFLRLGRPISMYPAMLLIPFFTLLLYYKDRPFDRYFFWFIPLYALVLMSHAPETILYSFLVIGLFLVKNRLKDWFFILGCILGSVIVASFWLVPFILESVNTIVTSDTYPLGQVLWTAFATEPLTALASVFIPFGLLAFFFINWKFGKSKQDLLFYSPLLFLTLIFFLRIYPLVPILQNIHPDMFHQMFIFFAIFFFFSINFNKFPDFWKKLAFLLLNLFVLANVFISVTHTPWFVEHTDLEKESLMVLSEYVDGPYFMYGDSKTGYSHAYYSYTPIHLDLPTVSGWYPHVISVEYKKFMADSGEFLRNRDCEGFDYTVRWLNITNLVGYGAACDNLDYCGYTKKASSENVCVYSKGL